MNGRGRMCFHSIWPLNVMHGNCFWNTFFFYFTEQKKLIFFSFILLFIKKKTGVNQQFINWCLLWSSLCFFQRSIHCSALLIHFSFTFAFSTFCFQLLSLSLNLLLFEFVFIKFVTELFVCVEHKDFRQKKCATSELYNH